MKRVPAFLAITLLTVSCAASGGGPAPSVPPTKPRSGASVARSKASDLSLSSMPGKSAVPNVEEQALLLFLVDHKLYEPFTVTRTVTGPPALRADLATTLGRVGDPRGLATLESLLTDPAPEVRRAAAFGLGLLADRKAVPSLLKAAADPDAETGRLAVEAAAKCKALLATVEAALGSLAPGEREARLLPSLARFQAPGRVAAARRGLAEKDPDLHRWAAYALTRDPAADAVGEIRALLSDPDGWIRSWAARALGKVGDEGDLARLEPLLADPNAGATIEALKAAAQIITAGKAAPPAAWRDRLLSLLEDSRPGVRITAIRASAAWLLDPQLSAALVEIEKTGDPWDQETALVALARGHDPHAATALARAARDSRPALRAAAAEAAGLLADSATLELLRQDGEASVRLAAYSALFSAGSASALGAAKEALTDHDPAVRASALEWLVDHPALPSRTIADAMVGPGAGTLLDLQTDGVHALVARAKADPEARPSIIRALGQLAGNAHFVVRRAAADGLVDLGQPRPAVGEAEGRDNLDVYRTIIEKTRHPRWVEVETTRGTLEIELDCPAAPLTCLSFLQLAAQGFFDGLTFHRVVPDFVVQGGDPRGDGWGGPGYTLRDEINRLRYGRGVVGMALSGPDTGGSQFFITLSPQPHLDGGYTAFGRVVKGEEILDRIEKGDKIIRIHEISRPDGAKDTVG
ncbi:MAG TPA: peptidylprolyl isomerase [Thermoanaerobaculia bacterium]|nr:peptidylprolyl isomerase [Thermoanaerobaculia bacterium]